MNDKRRVAVAAVVVIAAAVVVAVWLRGDLASGDGSVVPSPQSTGVGMIAPEGRRPAELPDAAEATAVPIEVTAASQAEGAEEPAAETFVIHGTVIAPDDTPIAGAVLTLSTGKADAEPMDTQTSDPEGRFRFEVAADPATPLRLVVNAEGFLSMSRGSSGWPTDAIELRLNWATTVYGVVRDAESGAPVAHAMVSSGWTEKVETASDGSYSLSGVAVGWEIAIVSEHPDYARGRTARLLMEPDPVEIDIELVRGVLVDCSIVDRQSGDSIAGVELHRRQHGEAFAHSDGSGRLAIRLAEGEVGSLTFVHRDYCPLSWTWELDETAGHMALRIPLLPAAWIDARVRDADGQVVRGAGVYTAQPGYRSGSLSAELLEAFGLPGRAEDLGPTEARRYQSTSQDEPSGSETGDFRIAVRPSETDYTLHAHHGDYVSTASGPLELRSPGDRVRVDLVLAQGGSIRGRVLRNGKPMEDVEVRVVGSDGEHLGRDSVWSEGKYSLKNVRAGEVTLTVRRSHLGDVLHQEQLDIGVGQELEHDILIEVSLATIEGRVLWTSGEPASERSVRARNAGESYPTIASVETDESGAFVLEVPEEGTFDVSVRHVASIEQFSVQPGARDVDFTLPVTSTLTLELVDGESRKPIRHTMDQLFSRWLSWRTAGGASYRGTSSEIDYFGRAQLEVPVGLVDLAIDLESSGYKPLRLLGVGVPEVPDSRPFIVTLERGASLSFRFLHAATSEPGRIADHIVYAVPEAKRELVREPIDGEPSARLNGVRVIHEDPELLMRWLRINGSGQADQQGLGPGRYNLLVFPPDLVLEPASFRIPRRDDEPLEVRWRPSGG